MLLWKYLVGDKGEIHFLKGRARTIRVSYMLRPTGFQKGGNPYAVYNYLNLPLHKEQMSTKSLVYKVFLIVMNRGSDLVVKLVGKYFS